MDVGFGDDFSMLGRYSVLVRVCVDHALPFCGLLVFDFCKLLTAY